VLNGARDAAGDINLGQRKGDRAKQAWERRKRCRKQLGNLSVKPCR
jgi:hypothetical protein